jgi:hypothetical protein
MRSSLQLLWALATVRVQLLDTVFTELILTPLEMTGCPHWTRIENPVLLLCPEYRAMDKSRDSQPVLLECDTMCLRGSVFTKL